MTAAYSGLRIAEVHALCELGSAVLEVRGQLIIRQGRRLSDHANHPDPMLELDEAATRVHSGAGPSAWEPGHSLSVNRDRVAVLLPFDESDPGADPMLISSTRDVLVRLVCPAATVTGHVKVPVASTVAAFIHQTRHRYLALTGARLEPPPAGFDLGPLAATHPFCLVNRAHVVACQELPVDPGAAASATRFPGH